MTERRATGASDAGRLYVYAVVGAGSTLRPDVTGIGGAPVTVVRRGRLAAAVSAVSADRIRPTRANVLAHQQLVSSLHEAGPVLPVRFGAVMEDEREVATNLLDPAAADLEERLDWLEGKDEYRLKVRYLPDVALREAVAGNPSIQRLRTRLQKAGGRAGRAEQMQLGELVVAELEQIRGRDALQIADRVAPHATAMQTVDDRSDDVPLHVALLVDRGRMAGLEADLEEISRQQEDRLDLELIGPLPAWDFSDLAGVA